MKIFPTSKVTARWDVTASVDLTNATARVLIDEVWYPMQWLTAATQANSVWTRTASLDVGGIDSDAAAKLTASQEPLIEVTVGNQKLVARSARLEVAL